MSSPEVPPRKPGAAPVRSPRQTSTGPGRPGSLLWLLRTQLRVSWRHLALRSGTRWLIALAAVLLLGGAAVLAPRLWAARGTLNDVTRLDGPGLLVAGAVTLFVFLLMFSAAISATLEALYERGDLDLLLGAPILPRVVLASRLLGVAVSSGTLYAVLAVPVLALALAAGVWRLLGLVPWLLALALVSASLGGLLTLGLVRLIGVRRARTAASIVGALSGAAFFLVTQVQNLRGRTTAPIIGQAQLSGLQAVLDGHGPLGSGSPLWYPARTLWLEPLPTVLVLGAALALFWLSVRLLEGAFQRGAQQAGMHGGPRTVRPAASGPLRFRSGDRALLVKEWRLLARDPLLLSRVLLQLVYLAPLAFVVFRNGGGAGPLIGGAGIVALGSLASSLAHITTNAEEAPELLMSAPQSLSRLRVLRLWAAVLPVLALWLPLTLGAALRLPALQALLGAGLGLWSIVGSALTVLWRPLELRRADLFRRGQRTDLLMTVSTLMLQGGLLLALYTLPRLPLLGLGGLLLAVLGPLLSWRGRATVR